MRKLGIPLMAFLAACNDPITKDSKIDCSPIPEEPCETGGEETAEVDNETESGDETADGPRMLGSPECVFNTDESKVGLQYTCFGELHTSLDLVVTGLFSTCEDLFKDDSWCFDDYDFGHDPKVVACCGEYDAEHSLEYEKYCTYDLYQQVCISLAERLEHLIKQGEFGAYANKAAKLQQYVAENYDSCFQAFLHNNVATLPYVQTHWALKKDFGLLGDVVFHIDADTRVDGVEFPDLNLGEAWPTCNGASYNNDTVFGSAGRLPIGEVVTGVELLDPVHAELSGPPMLGGEVTASMEFGTNCSALGCPEASFSHDLVGEQLGLETLVLLGDAFEISVGDFSLQADRVQIHLYAQAAGERMSDPTTGVPVGYEIPTGAASFLVAGTSGEISNRFMAVNRTTIRIFPEDQGMWAIDDFQLVYEDGNDEQWILIVEESQWQ